MKAVVFDRHGPPSEVLQLREVPPPVPSRGEVLVRMIASPINPSDLLYVEGRYGLKARLPATPGFEGVGVVESSGGGVLGWLRRGRRVAVINDRTGNWQERTVTAARQVIPVPPDIPDDQAACFFVNPATALVMTQSVLAVPAGEWLLQSAAGSALGQMIIRLGRRFGYRTLNVVRRSEQVDELKRLGADAVILEADGPIDEQVRRITGREGVRYAVDPVGGRVGSEVIAALAPGGQALLYGLLSGEPVVVSPRHLITGSKRVQGFWLSDWAKQQSIPRLLRLFRQVRSLMREGLLTTPIGETFPLERISEAVACAQKPGRPGKVLLRISPG